MVKRKEQDRVQNKTGSTPRKGNKQKQTKPSEQDQATKMESKSKATENKNVDECAENPGTKRTGVSTETSASKHSPAVETNNNNHNNYVEDEADPTIRLKAHGSILQRNARFNTTCKPNKYKTWSERTTHMQGITQRKSEQNESLKTKNTPAGEDKSNQVTKRSSPRFKDNDEVINIPNRNQELNADTASEEDTEAEEKEVEENAETELFKQDYNPNLAETLNNISAIYTASDSESDLESVQLVDTTFGSDNPDDDDTAELIATTRRNIFERKTQEMEEKRARQDKSQTINGEIHAITPATKNKIQTNNQNIDEEILDSSYSSESSNTQEGSKETNDNKESDMETDDSSKDSNQDADESMLLPKQLEPMLNQQTDETEEDQDFQPVLSKATKKKQSKNTKQNKITTEPETWSDIRYGILVKLQPSEEPLKAFAQIVKKLLRALQEQIHPDIYIGTWDPQVEGDTKKFWKKPQDVPVGNILDRIHFFNFFGTFVNPKRKQEDKLFLKLRIVTPTPNALPLPLKDIGKEFSDLFEEKINVKIYKNPYACQAVKVVTIGWLWGSTKTMNELVLLPAIKEALKMPTNVQIGLQWRTIKMDNRKTYQWGEDKTAPPQALHIDIDQNYAGLYAEKAAMLWKKGSKKKVCHLNLRLVPCFGGYQAIAMDDKQRESTLMLAQKQHYFINEYLTNITTEHIQALDVSVSKEDPTTLRMYLMGRSPNEHLTQRLFVSVDKSWRAGNDYTLPTPKKYAHQSSRILNNMIPECLATYGSDASKWFSTTGLLVYKNVIWDKKSGKTTSSKADETTALVNEMDVFGMGYDWKTNDTSQKTNSRPMQNTSETKLPPLKDIIAQRATIKDVQSLGSVFGRNKDDDTIATQGTLKPAHNPNAAIGTKIMFSAETLDHEEHSNGSIGMSTAGMTTGTTRIALQEMKNLNKKLQAEVAMLYDKQQLAAEDNSSNIESDGAISVMTTHTTKAALIAAQNEMEAMKLEMEELKRFKTQQSLKTLEAPVQGASSGAIADGAGHNN